MTFHENLTPIMWAVVGVAVLLIIMSLNKNGKDKKQGKTFLVVGLLSLVGVFLFSSGALTGFGGQTAAIGADGETVGLPAGTLCATEDTTVTLLAQDQFLSTASGGTHVYKLNNGVSQTVADAGVFTASPGDTLQILWGNESSDTYFGVLSSHTVPCKGTFEPRANGVPIQTVQNSTLSIDVFNQGGNIIDGNTINETVGPGDVIDLKVEIFASNDRGYPHGGVFIIEMNQSDWDEAETDFVSNDLSLTPVAVPSVHTLANTGNKAFAWEVEPFFETSRRVITLHLDADDSANPDTANDPIISFRPYDYFINEDTGASFDGPAVEDEDSVATFGHVTTSTVHLN